MAEKQSFLRIERGIGKNNNLSLGGSTYIGSYFPTRKRFNISYGSWLHYYRESQLLRLKTVLQTNIKSADEIKEELQKYLRKHPFKKKHPKSSVILDGLFILNHCCVEEPDEVISLLIQSNGLSYMNDEYFGSFQNLEFIDAEDNLLQFEPFSSFPFLRHLKLALNRLTTVCTKCGDFPFLQYLDLSYNYLKGDCFKYFGIMPNLQFLNLGNNNIEHLPTGSTTHFKSPKSPFVQYKCFPKLQALMLDYNRLENPDTFKTLSNLPKLVYLDLEGNKLYHIPQLLKENNKRLRKTLKLMFPSEDHETDSVYSRKDLTDNDDFFEVEERKLQEIMNTTPTEEDSPNKVELVQGYEEDNVSLQGFSYCSDEGLIESSRRRLSEGGYEDNSNSDYVRKNAEMFGSMVALAGSRDNLVNMDPLKLSRDTSHTSKLVSQSSTGTLLDIPNKERFNVKDYSEESVENNEVLQQDETENIEKEVGKEPAEIENMEEPKLHEEGLKLDMIESELDEEGSKLDEEGSKLDEEGSKLDDEGSKLDDEGSKLDEEGSKLGGEGSKLDGEESKLGGEGSKLEEEGSKLDDEGSKLDDEGSKLEEEGSKLDDEGSKLDDEGSKLDGEGSKLDDEEIIEKIEPKKEKICNHVPKDSSKEVYHGTCIQCMSEGVTGDTVINIVGEESSTSLEVVVLPTEDMILKEKFANAEDLMPFMTLAKASEEVTVKPKSIHMVVRNTNQPPKEFPKGLLMKLSRESSLDSRDSKKDVMEAKGRKLKHKEPRHGKLRLVDAREGKRKMARNEEVKEEDEDDEYYDDDEEEEEEEHREDDDLQSDIEEEWEVGSSCYRLRSSLKSAYTMQRMKRLKQVPVGKKKDQRKWPPFPELVILNLAHNSVFCQEALMAIKDCPKIQQLFLFGNPMVKNNNVKGNVKVRENLEKKLGIDIQSIKAKDRDAHHLAIQVNETRKVNSFVRKVPKVSVDELLAIEGNVEKPPSSTKLFSGYDRVAVSNNQPTSPNVTFAIDVKHLHRKNLKSDSETSVEQPAGSGIHAVQNNKDHSSFFVTQDEAEESVTKPTDEELARKLTAGSREGKTASSNAKKAKYKGYEKLLPDDETIKQLKPFKSKLTNIQDLRHALSKKLPVRRLRKTFTDDLILARMDTKSRCYENFEERIDKILKDIREEPLLQEFGLTELQDNQQLYKKEYEDAQKLLKQIQTYYMTNTI